MLYIVGSGPGDPELLTIKAYKTLKSADVVLYDHLTNENLLNLTPKRCIKVYVGKKPYQNHIQQEEIHALISWYCHRFSRVVRLKGGDPYIFGRGFEELCYAEEHGIITEYIPGISSMQGCGYHRIPLTHRGTSEGIWVLTGTKENGSFSSDLQLAIQSRATVVIYMGMNKLTEIARIYLRSGKGQTPAAIIQHATLPHQKQVRCQVSDLPAIATSQNLSYPAIIVIGDVVSLHPHVS
ncbi:MAG: uroporphyrinogen-III C-methyltransferase [Parapedobacter sp.]|nr:MAG: uroporphyrinogen-III C-methyltransferase [Parapedobacter sp.]